MKKVVGILQNAWSPLYANGTWPRESWLKALHKSRSGQRLRILIERCPQYNFWFDNTTPIVGDNPDSVIKGCLKHTRQIIKVQKPHIIVTFGRQAENIVGQINNKTPWLVLPHPAWRRLENKLYIEASNLLNSGFKGKIILN